MLEKNLTKALSVNQPWAWLLVNGFKPVENRDWPTNFRGIVLIHAGMKIDRDFDYWGWSRIIGQEIPNAAIMPKGGIVGEVKIVDCVTEMDSKFFFGKYGFVVKNAIAYEKMLPCKGALGFFVPDYNSRYVEKKLPERIEQAKAVAEELQRSFL